MVRQLLKFGGSVLYVMAAAAASAHMQDQSSVEPGKRVEADGSIHVPAMTVPASTFMSREARERLTRDAAKAEYRDPMDWAKAAPAVRAVYDAVTKAAVERAQARYAVKIDSTTMGGVSVHVVTPAAGIPSSKVKRVLINLHGGAFLVGGRWGGLLEAVPVAGMGGYKVITVDYRMAPEAAFPAASEDVAAVYKAVLRKYRPADVGIYGCSSGGTLTAQSVVWFAQHSLPRPGAIGVLCASLDPNFGGDSVYTSAVLTGLPPVVPPRAGEKRWPGTGSVPYMAHADLTDAIASPLQHPKVLSDFPPTLFITATRAPEMSAAVFSHQQLIKAGVDARLFVFEGMWHGFAGDVTLPESQDYTTDIVSFFDEQLGRVRK